MTEKHKISIFSEKLAVCRFDKDNSIPSWALNRHFICITRTEEELSLIVREALVPDNCLHDKCWQRVKVEGPLDLTLYGVLAALITLLSKECISVLAIATNDTDYLLVKETQM